LADDLDLARLRRFQQAAEMQKRGFAGPRRRHERHQFTAIDGEVGSFEHVHHALALAIVAVHAGKAQMRLTHSAAPPPDRIAPPARPDRWWQGSSAAAP